MRTNIEIDDKLIGETLKATGLKTKREVVDLALETLLRLKREERLAKRLRGKVHWEGDLEDMRLDK
ncbi:MAG: type II toxin-antitoxin system VapB family antitoxin [Acidobacteria bacterium]|nr:type II toxin-antitoxin system VapB family antitoxin [Acidobacteriota bacterium]